MWLINQEGLKIALVEQKTKRINEYSWLKIHDPYCLLSNVGYPLFSDVFLERKGSYGKESIQKDLEIWKFIVKDSFQEGGMRVI